MRELLNSEKLYKLKSQNGQNISNLSHSNLKRVSIKSQDRKRLRELKEKLH